MSKPPEICDHCKRPRTADGHDPCIAHLPGVKFACCGHGKSPGYVVFNDGRVLRGFFEGLGDEWPEHQDVWELFLGEGLASEMKKLKRKSRSKTKGAIK